MAADRFLDTEGLRHLWEKIKSFIHQNTHEYSVEELETPTAGYRNSYRLDKDGEAIVGSDTIDIPNEFTPLISKEYTGTDFYASGSTLDNSSRYFMSVRPDALNEYWYVKYRVRVWIPTDTTEKRFTDSIIEYFGSGISMKCYRIWNTINTGSATYYQVAYWLTNDGYNNQSLSNELGHIIGTSILYGTNYKTSSWYRHVKVDLLAYEGCEVNVFDNLVKWSAYKQSSGATNLATGIEHPDYGTTDPSTYNATSQGIQETGDATDTSNIYFLYARFTAGAYGMMNRSLIMQDGQGKWQSFTTSSGTSATKTKNPSGFRLGSNIYHLASTTNYASNDILSTGLVRAFASLIDFRYSLNITTTAGGANNLLPYKPIYIVGTLGNDGLFYLDDVWWTQDEPSTENGKIYIKVSPGVYNDYENDRCYRGDLLYNGDAYWYKDGLFQRYYGDFVTNAHLPEYTIEKLTQAETSYSASYVLKKDGTQVGATINIPKDMVVSGGEVKTVTTADVPYQGAVVGDKYIDLTIANTAQNHIYIPVKDLVDVYVAGNGIQISDNNYISVKINSNQSNGLGVGGDGVSLGVVTPSVNGVGGTNGSMLATDKEKLDGIEAGAEENVIETVKVSGTALQVMDKAVNIETETAYDPTTNKIATMSDLENSINGQKVWFNCWTCEYGVHPYSLFSFAINPNKDGLCLTPFTTTGGTGNKQPVTTYWFPIGSNIYYHNSSEQAGQSGALKSGYTSFREVDVRYSAITGGNISLGSSINTSTYFYTTSVFLRVLISGEYWQPYHESGSTTEILVSIDQLVAGNYYIYLGKLSAETTDGLHYILQLEDNNPLYYFDGNDLIMYTKRGNIPSGGTTRQFLAKRSNSDYDVEWIGPAAAFITAYDYQNHRVTISDGTHSQEYQLTPYYPIPDYYIGWEYGTKREFASMSGSHLANNATPYMKADNTSYQSECLDTIFYVMFKSSSAPTSGSLLSGDGVNSNKLLSQITAEEFLAGGNCPHNDVTIGETTYKVYALMNVYLADGDNTITVNFN